MSSQVEVEGNSIDEAIGRGLTMLGVTREQAQVEILRDARRSLLGFGGRKARVRVSLRVALPLAGKTSEENEATESVATDAEGATILSEILKRMGVEARIETTPECPGGQVLLRIASDSSGLLIGRHGQTLDALEYLLNRVIGRQEERGSRVVVDCEDYRERRARELEEIATRLADKVRQRGKPQTMVPMSPRERRVVHLALSNYTGVVTRSTGQGYFRRIVIVPARETR